jgi:hypothetical protein
MPVAYVDEQGYPRAADGSLYIEIGGNYGDSGGTFNTAGYDPKYDPTFATFMTGQTVNGAPVNATAGAGLPGHLSVATGLTGWFMDISDKTGIPDWVLMALAAATAVFALHELT